MLRSRSSGYRVMGRSRSRSLTGALRTRNPAKDVVAPYVHHPCEEREHYEDGGIPHTRRGRLLNAKDRAADVAAETHAARARGRGTATQNHSHDAINQERD
mgnify:CR=1 FL=1